MCNIQQTFSKMPTVCQALHWGVGDSDMVKPKLVPKKLKGKQIITKQHDKSNNHIVQATGGATGAKVIKAASEFHHPVRLFWPKSRSFDYLYSDGEILLQNFPIQATINLYEDSDDEEEEEEEEKEREEEKKLETDERGLGEHVRGPGSAPA